MQTLKSNLVWKLFLLLIFLRPFICQMCYPRLDIYYSLILLVCSLLWLIASPQISFKKHLNYSLLLLVTALIISTLFSINFRLSLNQIYKFIPYLVALYLMSQLTAKQKREVVICLITAGFVLSLYGIYQFFWGFQNIFDYLSQTEPDPYVQEFLARKRVFATFLSPNMFASYLIMIIPLTCALFLDSLTKKNRKLCLLIGYSIPFMLIALLLTKSIGGWISLFAAFLVFSILLYAYYPFLRRRRKILLAAVISCIVITSALAGIFITRADYFFKVSDQQNSIVQRLYFWKSTVKIIKDFPFIGIGPGNFGLIYLKHKSPQAIETNFAHNSYLQLWAETGILGIVAWLWLAARSFQIGLSKLKVLKERDYLLVGLLSASASFLVHNFIDFSFFLPEVAFHWWVILGLISFWPVNRPVPSNLQ